MGNIDPVGWRKLIEGHPWFSGEGKYPITAYSEFMPPSRLGRCPCGEVDLSLFSDTDDFGWCVSEVEEEYELQPGLTSLSHQIVNEIVNLGRGKPAHCIAGHRGRNLAENPYWPPDLAAQAGKLPHERYVVLLPLALSKTLDDKGRLRWTFFGGSEQGPERAFWKSFYSAPCQERPLQEGHSFLKKLLSAAYGERCGDSSDLHRIGFRVLPTKVDQGFPYWHDSPMPSWMRSFIWSENEPLDGVRYLLTFRPFSLLPAAVRELYLTGRLVLLPFPGSLVFWGMPSYIRLQKELPLAMQLPLQCLVARHSGHDGIKVPQSGWFHEPGSDAKSPEVHESLLLNNYKRTSRWDRVHRYENELALSTIEDRVGRTLFSTAPDVMGLYGKPMARNSQVWTTDAHLLLNGPHATREDLDQAAGAVSRGGTFGYRFQFPAMQVGFYEVYWQRPLIAYWPEQKGPVEHMDDGPMGYLTAYRSDKLDPASPIELWPTLQHREPYLWALRNFEQIDERYRHQTALNVVRVLDVSRRWGRKPVPRSLVRQVLHLPERETLDAWLAAIPERAGNSAEGEKLRREVESRLEPTSVSHPDTALPEVAAATDLPSAITYAYTARRAFEEAWWNDILALSHGEYVNKNTADCVQDPATLARLTHRHRDLESLGDYLLSRHRQAAASAQMGSQATCGELHFRWKTDFDFPVFGGWKNNQEGHAYERDLLVMIPGKNRGEAVILADHYDTAYMADIYSKSSDGSGARIAAAGADDNHSATATLLQSAPVFLKLSQQGMLERDIWLVHLTGEEFPSDCLGARHLAQSIVEGTLRMRLSDGQTMDLSKVRVAGVYIMDMIGHNRESDENVFQISPGKGRTSLQLAWQAHLANVLWNSGAMQWNRTGERCGKGHGKRSPDGMQMPQMAEHPLLRGEVRLGEDPHSTLFNTDGQIFSDCGIPAVLLMEDYDIRRDGYHDTKDTMENIDLDYGAAVAAIAIETVARAATIT
jgi:hypothetical protein